MNFFLPPTQKVIFNFTKKIINKLSFVKYKRYKFFFLPPNTKDIETILENHAEVFEEEDFTLEDKMPLIGKNFLLRNICLK